MIDKNKNKCTFFIALVTFLVLINAASFSSPLSAIQYNNTGNRFLQRKLKNGIRVIINENPNCQVVACEFFFKVGSMEEMETYAGINTLIMELILRGGGKKAYIPLQSLAEKDGCQISTQVNPDYCRISFVSTPEIFKENFIRVAEVIKKPRFDYENLEDTKKKVIFDIENNISGFEQINAFFLKHFYRYHPYRQPVYGYKKTIGDFLPSHLEEFYRRNYCANRITVSISGDVNSQEAMEMADKYLFDIPGQNIEEVNIPWEPVSQEKRMYLATSSNIAWLFVGFPAPGVRSPDYPKMRMLVSLLGEGLSSRMFIELREKEGLAYELSAKYPRLEGPSHMILYVMTNSNNLYQCRRKFFREINRIKKELVSEAELEAVRRKVLGQMLMEQESNQGKAYTVAFYSTMGLGANYHDILIGRLQKVTSKDIQDTARKYLENYTVLLIESIPEQFESD